MLRHILVATDFSRNAGNALAYAASLAEVLGAEITLFNVFHLAPMPGVGAPPASYMNQIEAEERQRILTQLEYEAAPYYERGLVVDLLARPGADVDELVKLTTERHFDLLVMGTKPKNRLDVVLFGSTLNQVLGQVKCPVLAVPEGCTYRPLRNLTFATALADKDAEVLAVLGQLARPFGAEVLSLHLSSRQTAPSDQDILSRRGSDYLFGAASSQTLEVLVDDQAVENLDDFLLRLDTDLLAVAYRNRSAWQEFWEHSHTKNLLARSQVPVLVFK
ncbi:MAG: universal stress protein [Bernardetiaceae bacterium]|jgi:nucleotide-binding universal stress UspA family protein|nr:universal stress protein [Bernardetiaceae bacterium]